MIVADLEKGILIHKEDKSMEDPDPVLESVSSAPILGHNSTSLRLVYSVDDGVVQASCLEVYNGDYDPNGEELPGSVDEQREMTHYASVMGLIQNWLTVGE